MPQDLASDDAGRFFDALDESLAAGSFVRLTLSKPRGREEGPKNVYVRPVALKGGARLSFLHRRRTRDEVSNHTREEGARLVRELLGAEFASGRLFTTAGDFRLDISRKGEARLTRHPPTFKAPPAEEHDRRKRRSIEAGGSVYLRELGVTNERGEARPAMGDKLRQIHKFVEIVAGLYAASPLAGREEFTVLDVGSGKGYLTFAVYDYFNNALGKTVPVTGVEARAELVGLCNEVAGRAGFGRLSFLNELIQDLGPTAGDILIALHACDTATDEAIYKGVAGGASVIVTAPCCHREVRPQMSAPAALRGVLRHGHLLEREAESVTDSLRALLLEGAGYDVKVFEFVSNEHTRKNTMIAAVRRRGARDRESALAEYRALKEFYGIREQRLEKLLCDYSGLTA